MAENQFDTEIVADQDAPVAAVLDGEIELETADTSFTYTEPRY